MKTLLTVVWFHPGVSGTKGVLNAAGLAPAEAQGAHHVSPPPGTANAWSDVICRRCPALALKRARLFTRQARGSFMLFIYGSITSTHTGITSRTICTADTAPRWCASAQPAHGWKERATGRLLRVGAHISGARVQGSMLVGTPRPPRPAGRGLWRLTLRQGWQRRARPPCGLLHHMHDPMPTRKLTHKGALRTVKGYARGGACGSLCEAPDRCGP